MTPQFANMFFVIVVMGLAYYFIVHRPKLAAQKRIELALESMAAGDTVLTKGGLIGSIVDIDSETVDLKVSEQTTVKVLRGFVARVMEKAPASITA
jgi:preprotein translocase subunit YajC